MVFQDEMGRNFNDIWNKKVLSEFFFQSVLPISQILELADNLRNEPF